MRSLVLLAGAVAVAAAGVVAGYFVGSERGGETTTATSVLTQTETETVAEQIGLPAAVAEKHRGLLEAAESGDYESLRPLIDPDVFEYTFGGPVQGGPIAYWRNLERTTKERPIETLEKILRMPYTLHRGIYVWPFVFDKNPKDLTKHEIEVLAPIASAAEIRRWGRDGAYFGWRAGITAGGDWQFFVAGD